MTITMYDTIGQDVGQIPLNPDAVEGYVDGAYAWTADDWALFPDPIIKIRTAVFPSTDDGNELDIETGDATPDQAPAWVRMRVLAGLQKVSLYMNASTWPSVKAAVDAAGLTDHVVYRVAEWTGQPHEIAGAWAVQYSNPDMLHVSRPDLAGRNLDLSLVSDVSWLTAGSVGPAPAPQPEPEPAPAPGPRELSLQSPMMTGEDVVALQHILGVVTDGVYGPQTKEAVVAFQASRGLSQDGIVGPQTREALVRLAIAVPIFPGQIEHGDGLTGEPWPSVAAWQQALTVVGFDTRGVDGRDGDNTTAAIRAAQNAHGVQEDGIGGHVTWYAIH